MARWHICNVLRLEADRRRLWLFEAVRHGFKLNREHTVLAGKPLPQKPIVKSWDSLWRRRLNVALLPHDKVFFRVVHLPAADEDEARQIVELQLERLSPLPVAQTVWTLHLLPKGNEATRAAVVLIVDRGLVEKQLGQLEAEGFLADRLELPLLDQVLADAAKADGAWIYPLDGTGSALVAWWTEGELRSLAWLNLPPTGDRESLLRDHLHQMSWAGELEGWLHGAPRFHLVADAAQAAVWQPLFGEWVDSPVDVQAPLPPAELVAHTARRTAAAESSLMPPEYLKRYQQQFVDRLWMRGLGAVVVFYIVGVLIYFAALSFVQYKLSGREKQLVQTGLEYTNVLQNKQVLDVLTERQELQYAALDCWKAVAEELPAGAVVDAINFSGGTTLTVNGTADSDQMNGILDFYERLRRYESNGRPLFSRAKGEAPVFDTLPANRVRWRFNVELDRAEEI